MKPITLVFFCLLFWNHSFAQMTFDTTGGRYSRLIFDSVEVIPNLIYSNSLNLSGQLQELSLDLYQPFGDLTTARPVLVMVHGGSFLQGNKADMALTCKHFAKKGYVTASIQYRLGYSSLTPAAAVATVIRATQDLKNAIRYLRKTYSEANPYKIHPDYIFAGGVSAGAITTLHAAYMDQMNEILPGQIISSLDSLHNSGQIPGFDWKFKAAINIAGGIGDTNWIQPGDIPVTSFHGTADAVVSYNVGTFGGAFALYGSYPVFLRTQNLGITSELRPFPGAGHDYTLDNPGATDTTQARITRFLLPFIIQNITGKKKEISPSIPELRFGPNGWIVLLPEGGVESRLFDIQGKYLDIKRIDENQIQIPFHNYPCILRIITHSGKGNSILLPGWYF